MPKHMTGVFDDEELYAELEAAVERSGLRAGDIVAEAVREWLETKEDEELRQALDEARGEWETQEGVEAGEFLQER